MVRLFKPGDRVKLHDTAPVMEVLKYAREYNPLTGEYESTHLVECEWYDPEEKMVKKDTFHQKSLFKVS